MRSLGFGRCALGMCAAAAIFAGCGGSQPPIGAPGAMPQTSALATHGDRGTSWMLPEAKNEDLLYVTNSDNSGGGTVSVYAYPSGKNVGGLDGFDNPVGSCVDNVGNVFITNSNGRTIYEYSHGGAQPINTLETADNEPIGCAIDPLTGNLAVATLGEGASVAIYRNARGKPKFYLFRSEGDAYYCSYDGSGNLFVDGYSYYQYNNHFLLAELPRGKKHFTDIRLNETLYTPTGVQWDGKYIVVGDGSKHQAVYRVDVMGSQGIIKRTISLADPPEGFWIRGERLINANYYNQVEFFRYPAGGSASKNIADGNFPSSVTVSPALH
jgi:hypothetical protein